jgi:heat shock protein HslJ
MIATKMACPGMEFEHDYLRNFTGNVGYRVEAGKLHLQVSPDSAYTYQTTR